MIRTRFAPSPTGDLHLGGAWVALASWVLARRSGGSFVVRVEDLDGPRTVGGAEARILEDLRWLGLEWHEGPVVGGSHGPYRQSERAAVYVKALEQLTLLGHTYPCDCSRAEIARVASAPHPGEEVVYPGTCRAKEPTRAFKREPAIRLRLPPGEVITIVDGVAGPFSQRLAVDVGDFVLRRGDGVFAYQLAVAVDDMQMQISDVLRGADLLGSTPRQARLIRLLSSPDASAPPRYTHLPMVTAPNGERLAKRTQGATIRELREKGVAPEAILGRLAHGLGLSGSPSACSTSDLVQQASGPIVWRREPWPVPSDWDG